MIDYYEILEIPRDATADQIRKAFRVQAKKHHPDMHASASKEELERIQKRFILLAQAHEVLSDPAARKKHDEQLARAGRSSQNRGQRASSSSSATGPRTEQYRSKPRAESPRPEPADSFEKIFDDLMADLLGDAESLLKNFGLGKQSPLEMLVKWAKEVLQALFVDDDSANNSSNSHSAGKDASGGPQGADSKNAKGQTGSSNKPEEPGKSPGSEQAEKKSPGESDRASRSHGIEEELARLKYRVKNAPRGGGPATGGSGAGSSKPTGTAPRSVQSELDELKKKYGK